MTIMNSFSIFTVVLGLSVSSVLSKSPHDKLLVVSYDGFRYDYLDMHLTPYLNSLKKNSTYAKCLLNVFPTQTFVNHFSLATGMYSGVHGVIGNSVYDNQQKKLMPYSYDLFHYNDRILPIWAVNEASGKDRHSGIMMWPGGDYAYSGTNVTFLQKFETKMPWQTRTSKVISWFNHPKTPANLVMMYFEEPDDETHASGPAPVSATTRRQVMRVDVVTKHIMESLRKNGLEDVNVVFLSDHGAEGVTLDRIVNLTKFVGEKASFYGTSPVLHVYPKSGATVNEIYNKLNDASAENKNFKVYLRKNIPKHFYVKDCKRTGPILAVAKPTYAFQDYYSAIDWQIKNKGAKQNGTYGVHGYDPEDVNMHPFFIAHGPLFRNNHAAGELRTIDMFPMFSHILKVGQPPVKPNGTFTRVEDLFKYNHHL